ncbi:MAG: hypothetical protein ACOCUV_00740 [bacterium]
MSQKIKISDNVKYGKRIGTVVGIILRGKGYREYECLFPDLNGEPCTYRLPDSVLEITNESSFGFRNKKEI